MNLIDWLQQCEMNQKSRRSPRGRFSSLVPLTNGISKWGTVVRNGNNRRIKSRSFNTGSSSNPVELLETRILLHGVGGHEEELHADTSAESLLVAHAVYERGPGDDDFMPDIPDHHHGPQETDAEGLRIEEFQFDDGDRWTSTTTDGGGLGQGDATTLTWSIVPDGTSIFGYNGEGTSDSDLVAFLGDIYGVATNDANYTDEPWFPLFEDYLNRWGEVSGLTYIYEPNDDGSAWTSNSIAPGEAGVRGDMRISGHFIDGEAGSNILAYNFFPDFGDMVIDTGNPIFYGNTNQNSLALRNVLAHENGHGIGLSHVCPVIATADGRLMEPFINLNFDGPQFDDILAANRGYGDALEKNGGNDTSSTATVIGDLLALNQFAFGSDADDNRVDPNDTNFVSIDDDSDEDFYSFSLSSAGAVTFDLTPLGPTYLSGAQNPNGTCSPGIEFNAAAQSDLTLTLLAADGSTVIQTANVNGLEGAEQIVANLASGNYFLQVTGANNAAQMYELSGVATLDVPPPGVTIVESDDSTDVAEGGDNDTYTVVLDSQPTANVVVTINPGTQLTATPTTLTFTAADWDTPQSVSVLAVDDAVIEGDHQGTIMHTVASADADYDGIAVVDVEADITDNDFALPPGITVTETGGSTTAAEGGAGDSYSISLDSPPTDDVTITIDVGTQLTADVTTLTFTAANWNTPQVVQITAVDDYVQEGNHNQAISHTVASADADYNNFVIPDISVAITDNDVAIPAQIVVTTALDENDGTIDPNSGSGVSLREAILAANSNPDASIITFDAALNGTPIVLSIAGMDENQSATGDLDVSADLMIVGNGIGNTIINANGIDRAIEVANGATGADLILSGVTVQGGDGVGNGGGLLVGLASSLSVENSLITGNSALNNGGGIANNLGTLNVVRSTIDNNDANFNGGGISNIGQLMISDSTISNNANTNGLGVGGGVYIFDGANGTASITQTTISGNSSNRSGGGLFNQGETLDISHSTITGNRADSDLDPFDGFGGGIASNGGPITMTHTIVAGNFVGTGTTADDIDSGDIVVANSVFNLIGDAGSAGGLTDGTTGNIVGNGGTGTRDINTILNTTLGLNGGPTRSHVLVAGSAAIDAGDPAFASPPDFDQRGNPFQRVANGLVDIGAIEFNAGGDPPVIDTAPFTRFENQSVVGQVIATDADQDDSTLQYSITGNGADDGLFSITNSGVLSFNGVFDFENPTDMGGDNQYDVEVQVTDDLGIATVETISVIIEDAVDNQFPGGVIPVLTNGQLVFSTANGSGIQLDDQTSPGMQEYTIELEVSSGRLLVNAIPVGTVMGQDSALLTITGTYGEINARLENLAYVAGAQEGLVALTLTTTTTEGGQMLRDVDEQLIQVVSEFTDSALKYSTFGGENSITTTGRDTIYGDDFVPVDTDLSYTISASAKSGTPYNPANRQYFGFASYDIDLNAISKVHTTLYAGSAQARLTQQLNDGDTIIHLDTVSGWNNGGPGHARTLAWYGYADSTGRVYDDYTYTQNVVYSSSTGAWDAGSIDYVNNTITLSNPWAGGRINVGTAFSNNTNGATFNYAGAYRDIVPDVFTNFSGTIEGIGDGPNQFRHGTAFIRSVILTNRHSGAPNEVTWSNVQFDHTPEAYQPLETVELQAVEIAGATYSWRQIVNTGDPTVNIMNDDQRIAHIVAPLTATQLTLQFEVDIQTGASTMTVPLTVIIEGNELDVDAEADSALDFTTINGQSEFTTDGKYAIFGDDFVAVDTTQDYIISGTAVSSDPSDSANRQYLGFASYDADQNLIRPWHVNQVSGSAQAKLTRALRNGDTVIHLDDVSGWNNAGPGHSRTLAWYGYRNSFGFTYEDYTYTRNVIFNTSQGAWAAGAIDYANNTVTLREAWSGGTLGPGTAFTNNEAGDAYNYSALRGAQVAGTETDYTGFISGVGDKRNQFRHGTAFIKTLLLTNYGPQSGSRILSEVSWSNLQIDRLREVYRSFDLVELKVTDVPEATFNWRQVAGPAVVLSNTDQPKTQFMVPMTTEDLSIVFEVDVVVGNEISTIELTVDIAGN